MAAYTADYKSLQPNNGNIPISQLQAMNANEVANGTAANNAYAAGWAESANFSEYTTSGGGSGFLNYIGKTFVNNTATT